MGRDQPNPVFQGFISRSDVVAESKMVLFYVDVPGEFPGGPRPSLAIRSRVRSDASEGILGGNPHRFLDEVAYFLYSRFFLRL